MNTHWRGWLVCMAIDIFVMAHWDNTVATITVHKYIQKLSSWLHIKTLSMVTHKTLFGYTHRLSSWLHIKTLSTVMHRLSSWLTWTLLRAFFTETFFRDTHRDSIQSYKQTLFIATNTTQTNKSTEWPTFADSTIMLDETEALLCQPLPPLPVLGVPLVCCWNHKRPPWIHTDVGG